MQIVSASRSKIRVEMSGRILTMTGEGMPGGQSVDFYADAASIQSWEDGTPVSASDRASIVKELPTVAGRSGFKLVID